MYRQGPVERYDPPLYRAFYMEEAMLEKLTVEEIATLQVEACQGILLRNVNRLADINNKMFTILAEKGKYAIEEAQLKNEKTIMIEQNRALKAVIESG